MSKLSPAGWCIRQKARHFYFGWIINDFLDPWIPFGAGLWIAEPIGFVRKLIGISASSVWIGGTDIEEEWFFRIVPYKGFRVFGHDHWTARIPGDGLVELVYAFGSHVVFAATSGAITAVRKVHGKADEVFVAVELVVTMLVAVMTVRMIVQAR